MHPRDSFRPSSIADDEQLPRNAAPRQPVEKPQIPAQPMANVATFTRVARDGTIVSPYNHKSGSFSPSVVTKASGIDYTKSAPVPRQRIPKAPLGDNTDVNNRMNQASPGVAKSHRMVGCPPGSYLSTHNRIHLHMRSNSGPTLGGSKRDIQGQVIT